MTVPKVSPRKLLSVKDLDTLCAGQGYVFYVPSQLEGDKPREVGSLFYHYGFGVLSDASGNLVGRYKTTAEAFAAVVAFYGVYTSPVTAVRAFTGLG